VEVGGGLGAPGPPEPVLLLFPIEGELAAPGRIGCGFLRS
jgi:hypothetical protein